MNKLQRCRAPIYEMLEQYRIMGNRSYHVPGHKNGEAYDGVEGAGFLDEVMKYDVTEISGTDDLHHPEGVIKEAQELAADCFGAEESFFLVGGSTAGNLALILTACPEPGMIMIVQRNVHKSVIHGLMLAGVRAVFLEPLIDPLSGLAVAPAAEAVKAALAAYPEAAAVLVTMPNYYGMGSDLAPLARICHDSGVPLLVDEAHGAHYGQHPALPAGALACGVDGVVQSTHKMLTAMTMGAMLHVQGPRLDRALLRQRLAMVLRRGLAELPRYGLVQPAEPLHRNTPPDSLAAYVTQDPFKVVIYDVTGVLSGFELQRKLEAKGCVPEMSDDRHVVLLFSLGSKAGDADHLLQVLWEIDSEEPSVSSHTVSKPDSRNNSTWNNFHSLQIPAPVPFSLKPVSANEIESIDLEHCMGRVAAEMVIPYPPGIPILYPGEVITDQIQRRLAGLAKGGAKFQACADPVLQRIEVYNIQKGGEA